MYDESKAPPVTSPDTNNATKFHQDEAPDGYRLDGSKSYEQHYKHMKMNNTGLWNGKWANKKIIRTIDNLAMYDAIASQLGLTDRQKRIGRSRLLTVDNTRYGKMGGVRAVAFCLCKLVCGEDGRDYYPTRKGENNDSLFVEIADKLGLSQREIEKVIPKVRSELS